MAPERSIILYLYPFSPFGRRVTAYLLLRRIPHSVVHQPPVPPRPDLDALGIRYRRIPLMSIGRDFYCDTKIILAKLEQLFPGSSEHPSLAASKGTDKALEQLLEIWATDLVFTRMFAVLPPDLPALNDEAFAKDRTEAFGGTWSSEHQKKVRPAGVQTFASFFQFLETLMAGRKKFALGEHGPGLADIHVPAALYIFHWLLELIPGAIPDSFASEYPDTYAWIDRYRCALDAAAKAVGNIPVISGDDAAERIRSAGFAEEHCMVDAGDAVAQALGLEPWDEVDVWPEDVKTGHQHQDTGALAALTGEEVAVMVGKGEGDGLELRVHFPRWNYRIERTGASK